VEVAVKGAGAGAGKLWRLHAETTVDTNTLAEPRHIVPVESAIPAAGGKLEHTVPGYSIEVIELPVE
jgi:alpha-N-arabinofuranosidase